MAMGKIVDGYERARDYCLRLLAIRPRSRRELLQRMRQRGYSKRTAQSVLERLDELGLVNDAELANAIVRSALERRPRGRFALAAEMRRLGLTEECIRRALDALDTDTEVKLAVRLLRGWLARWQGELSHRLNVTNDSDEDAQQKAKLWRRAFMGLSQRGFSANVIHEAFRQIGWKGGDDVEGN